VATKYEEYTRQQVISDINFSNSTKEEIYLSMPTSLANTVFCWRT